MRNMVAKLSGTYSAARPFGRAKDAVTLSSLRMILWIMRKLPPPGIVHMRRTLRQQTSYPRIRFQHEPGMKMAV
ncbi:MAG: hypothetical protein ABIQ51_16780, partial [Mesorhizobium sp.]